MVILQQLVAGIVSGPTMESRLTLP